MSMQEQESKSGIISTNIFSYGIIRKHSFITTLLTEFGLECVKCIPDSIQGYVPYSSNGINMVYPVTQKQKDKYPNAEFLVEGTILKFMGSKNNLDKLHNYLDMIEGGYKKSVITTTKGNNVWLYYMQNDKKQLYHLDGIGLVIYEDSVTDSRSYTNPEKIPDNVKFLGDD